MFGLIKKMGGAFTPGIMPDINSPEGGAAVAPKMTFMDKLGIAGGMIRDLDPMGGGGHGNAAQRRVDNKLAMAAQEEDRLRKLNLAKEIANGNPTLLAAAQINPELVAQRAISNEMLDPLAVNADKRAERGLDLREQGQTFNQNMATQQFDYRQGRDELMDARYADNRDYARGRDAISDEQWQKGFDSRNYWQGQNLGLRREQMNNAAMSGTDLGRTPIFLQNSDGSLGIGQLGNGEIVQTRLPDGVSIMGPYEKASATQQGRAAGAARGEAGAGLPNYIAGAKDTLQTIDFVKNHPGMEDALGPIDSRKPDWMLGDNARGFNAAAAQLQGQTFLQGYQQLKGAGVITDFEGRKAEESLARLDRAQSPQDYQAALDDFGSIVVRGMARQYERAGQPIPEDVQALFNQYGGTRQPLAAQTSAPQIGQIVDGYQFIGGDPSNPQSWRKAQ